MGARQKRRISGVLAFLMIFSLCFDGTGFQVKQVVKAAAQKIDVWDIAGTSETDATLYSNHISSTYWNTSESVDASGKFVSLDGSVSNVMDDLTITYVASDRLYNTSEDATKTAGTYGKVPAAFEDGYVGQAAYYCNGTGGAGRRCFTIANVNQGDKISVYTCLSNGGDTVEMLNFSNQEAGGTQLDSAEVTPNPQIVDFVADEDGTYKLYSSTTGGGKFMYYRIVRTPGVQVTGAFDMGEFDVSGYDYGVKFVNGTTGKEIEATVTNGAFEAVLAAGYTYKAVLTGVQGYGISNDTTTLTTDVSQIQTGSSGNTLKIAEKKIYTYSGSVTGFDRSYDISKLHITFKAPKDSSLQDVEASISDNGRFAAVLEDGVTYTIQLAGVNDYEIISDQTMNQSTDLEKNIEVSLKSIYEASGIFEGLGTEAVVTELQFVNVEDSYTYTGTVTENGYTASLRDGSYSVEATVNGYKTSTHVVVNGANVVKNLLFVSTDTQTETLERVSDVYVGYSDQANNYETVKEAVAACKAMNPASEEQRITVHISPGVYREQIFIDTPYLTFVNDDPKQEVKLTWYYGIGYRYYSADADGYYNVENAYDQYEKNIAAKWGCATYVRNTATAFRAEGITFEASFNRYVTEEELADGVEVSRTESITYDRTAAGADVTSKAATERATALYVDADYAEFKNCTMLGSQDTLFTGNTASHTYYKNCVIEGNTDYIFGDGDAVFDSCELKWFGYSDSAQGGYITAARPNNAHNGYLFLNCSITGNTEENVVNPGYLGRPWGANAKAAFLNTTLADAGFITGEGWTQMSGALPENANYIEYNTKLADGTKADVSERVTGAAAENPNLSAEDYFGSWTPVYYTSSTEEPEGENTAKHKIWVIGDSTVSAFTDAYYYPRYGWGTQLQNFINPDKYEVVNLAISGTSSKDYTTKAEYTTLLNGMCEGDYLFIGFGHNDEKTEAARYTNPNGDYTTEGSFANSLYTNYILPAQTKGCTTVLCTPIVRRTTTTDWASSNLHITSDSEGFPGGNYPQAIRDLGATLNIPVVDMTAMTKELYDTMGPDETRYLHAWTSSKASSVDNTHTNFWGGTYNAYLVAKTAASLNLSGLSKAVLSDKIVSAPAKADYFVSNPDYVEKEYDNNLKDSTLWNDYGIWKGTVFGGVGGDDKINTTNFNLGADENGAMNISVTNNTGKISSTVDGIAMYYYKVPVGSTFTLTATAKVNNYVSNDQVSFGLMARDDMYIDVTNNAILGDYVAAAPLKLTKAGAIWNSFARKSGVLTQGGNCAAQSVTAGESYDLKIQSNTDGYACTFGEEETITAGFDFQLTSIDSDYVYVGMFACRNADVTFSNIKLVVDGKEIADVPATSETPVPSAAPTPSTTPEVSVSPSPSPSQTTSAAKPVFTKNLDSSVSYTYATGDKAATLSVSAAGKSLTYQWYYNTSARYSGATKISGATGKTYTPSTTKVYDRYYFVKVTSHDNSKDIKTAAVNSNRVKVVVNKVLTKTARPSITLNLLKNSNGTMKTYSYYTGGKATTLKVAATGKKITYQWYQNTTASYAGAAKIAGETSAAYKPSTTTKGTNYYFVKIYNTDNTKDIKKVTGYSRIVNVTVKKAVTSIKCDNITVKAGKTKKLTVTVLPTSASNKKVTYKSSNTKYAAVSSTGVVTAKKAGKGKTVTITITSKDNSKVVTKVKVTIQ